MAEPETMMDVLLKFTNGAVMTTPIDRSKPVSDTFRLTSEEGAIFLFTLVDVMPSGRLVYKELLTDDYREKASK